MKTKIFTAAVTLALFAITFTSCSSSKSSTKKYPEEKPTSRYPGNSPSEKPTTPNPGNLPPGQAKKIYGSKSAKEYAPGQQKKQGKHYPLIIVRTPTIIILRHADGRYFYKNEDNYIYWQGGDDRFYLDEQYLEKVEYDKNELETWKGKGNDDANGKAEKKIPPGQAKKEEVKEEHGNGKGKSKKN